MSEIQFGVSRRTYTVASSCLHGSLRHAPSRSVFLQFPQRYHQAAEVQTKAKLLESYLRQHFDVVQGHVSSQIDIKSSETGEPG